MKNIKIFLNLFLITTVLIVNSCKKADDNNSLVNDVKKSISKKWIIENVKSTLSSDYKWFEFNLDNTYLIGRTDGTFLSGSYTISDDAKSITLINYGVMTINSLSDTAFAFTLVLNNSTDSITLSANPAPVIASSSKTDLFCRNWKIDKTYEYEKDTTILYPNAVITKFEVIFSKYGTYFVTDVYEGTTEYMNLQWKWKDQSETVICYGDLTCNCNGDNEVSIVELTNTLLKMDEGGDLYFLSPVENTKSAQAMHSSFKILSKPNLFGLK
jgi:hypothetical protein